MKFSLLLSLSVIFISLSPQGLSKNETSKALVGPLTSNTGAYLQRNLILGNIIKSSLEGLHFNKRAIDDELSAIAFKQYLKFLDFGKRFLIKKDIDVLKNNKNEIDNQIISGRFTILELGEQLLRKRIKQVQIYVKKRIQKPFHLETKALFQLDPKKKSWPKGLNELYHIWDQILLVDVINNHLDLEEEQDESLQKKRKGRRKGRYSEGKKKGKKLSAKDIRKKAIARTKKTYLRVFERMLREDYNDQLNKLFNAIAKTYDPHTEYLPPREKEGFNISMSGSLEGIGAVLREDGNYIKVVEIIPGSASWRGKKLKPEDLILKVAQGKKEAVDIVGMRVEDVVQLIRGKKNTEVRLTVKHGNGSTEIIPIIRDVVVIEESYVKYSLIQRKGSKEKFGYIQVPTFYRDFKKNLWDKTARNCTTDVNAALKSLKKLNVSGIILDLRNNGGGSLEDARKMSGLFVKKGPIVQVKNYEGRIEVLRDSDPKIFYEGPLVVLTNKFSASASEILASAMQDYGRAVIVGGPETHGKGTVQTLLDLDNYVNPKRIKLDSSLGSLKLTVQKFYRVTGGSTQFNGVTPDIILPDPTGYLKSGEKHHDFALPWDEVKPLTFQRWPKPLELKELKRKSALRVKKNKKFQNILKNVALLKIKREHTEVPLSLSTMKARRIKGRQDLEHFKFDEIDKSVLISHISLDKKLLNKDQKERKKEWVEGLKKDPYITETLQILTNLSAIRLAKQS